MIGDIMVASLLPLKYSDNQIEIGLEIEFAFSGIVLILQLLPRKLDLYVCIEIGELLGIFLFVLQKW